MHRLRGTGRRALRVLRRLAARTNDDRGAVAVELAILTPAILLALFASIEAASYFLARSIALTAAQQGTTAERAYNAPQGVGAARAETFLAQTGDWLGHPHVTVTRQGDQVVTVVDGEALSVIPGLTFHVRQQAHGNVERFTTEDQP